MGCVINDMARQDAEGPVALAFSEIVPIADAQEMIANTRGESHALCIQVPSLQPVHIEMSFRDAVKEHTWPTELDALITGPMAWCAQLLWQGQFSQLSRQILSYLCAEAQFMNTGLCFKRAINNSTSTTCTTWCKFTLGDFCLISLQHVDCLETPSTGFLPDGAPRKFQDAQGQETQVQGVKKALAVFFSFGADGITL